MNVLLLFLSYFFVIIIHTVFIGLSGYMIFGKQLEKWNKYLVAFIFMIPIVFFEFYWIPIMNFLKVSIFIADDSILSFFSISKTTNIVKSFSMAWFQPIVFVISAYTAQVLGHYYYTKIKKQ